MYMPTLARFTSRDPLPETGAAVLGGVHVQSGNAYAYCESNTVNKVDPSGMESERATCNVELECMNFVALFGGPEHCGLNVALPGGDTRSYHVLGPPTCDPYSGRPIIPIWGSDYFSRGSVIVDHAVCECIEETADRIRRQKLPYSAIPGNNPCG